MRLEYQRVDQLPPLAWLAILDFERGVAAAYGGSSVVATPDWIFEGAWAGPLELGGFHRTQTVFGSGLHVEGNRVFVCPPTTTLESVYYYPLSGQRVLVSNSPVALMAVTDDRPRLDQTNYLRLFETARFGPDSYVKTIRLRRGALGRVLFRCVEFTRNSPPRILPRPAPPRFDSFHSYRTYVAQQLKLLVDNASSKARERRYSLMATISSGYDSPTCAVFAHELGCRQAVSLKEAREQFGNAADSGDEVAKHLGMEIRLFDRLAYLNDSSRYEAQFVSVGLGAEDIVFASFGAALRGKCLLTGMLGDKVWGFDWENIGLNIARADNGGGSLGEFRLDTDFVHVAVPFVGILGQRDILAISLSREMEPWRIGGEYDRPIARRIVESSGVHRGAFGVSKKAITVTKGQVASFEKLNPQAAIEYKSFLELHALSDTTPRWWRRACWRAAHFFVERLVWRKPRLPPWLKRIVNTLESRTSVLEPPSGPSTWLYHWSVDARSSAFRALRSAVDKETGVHAEEA